MAHVRCDVSVSRLPGPLGRETIVLEPGMDARIRPPVSLPGVVGLGQEPGPRGRRPLPATTAPNGRDGATENQVIETLHAGGYGLTIDGRRLRLIRAVEWPALRNDGRYELLEHDEARQLLARITSEPGSSPARVTAAGQAIALLANTAARAVSAGLMLLRIQQLRHRDAGRNEPPLTPSQFARLAAADESEEDHWIEIELVWADGKPAGDELYLIVTPDGQEFRGITDARGRARVDGIARDGQCQVSFPDLYDEDWRHA
jgi:hypothetical protein